MNKTKEFFKLWWMITWRTAIPFAVLNDIPSSGIAGAIGFSSVIAISIILGTNKSVYTFPLIRLLLRKPVIISGEPAQKLDKA